jgi:DNA invertase Pin-like site-specific DNA recombinase
MSERSNITDRHPQQRAVVYVRQSTPGHMVSALTGTLIADADGMYSAEFNDRLLLGLKGTMSEAELHLIRSRLRGALENKARRGELHLALPIGLERDEDGEIRLALDEQVRGAIRRV